MDQEQTEQIIKRLELGEPLSKITKDKNYQINQLFINIAERIKIYMKEL